MPSSWSTGAPLVFRLPISHPSTYNSVHLDLSIVVRALPGSDIERVREKIKKRALRVLCQQRDSQCYLPDFPPRRYVSGETHRYLGCQSRLKAIKDPSKGMKLNRGYITVCSS